MTHPIARLIALAVLATLALAAQANGQLDSGFGPVASGKTSTFFPLDASLQRGATRVVKVLVQADNKTLLISNTPTPFGAQFPGNSQIGVTRLNADGSPDTSYGPRGQQLFDAGVDFEVEAVDAALRADGALLVLGTLFGPFNQSDMAVWAVLPNGRLDPNFASGGLLRIRRGGTPSDIAGAIEPYELSLNRVMIAGAIRDGTSGPRDLMHVATSSAATSASPTSGTRCASAPTSMCRWPTSRPRACPGRACCCASEPCFAAASSTHRASSTRR
jgi:hypothetical protein